ncbi:MAG TPA: CRISPR-associated endonuclease Cas2 [Saprospiraceae bacterium]|nr:CRISPR-associated endonuclease Cas2 [Saprospiraceae bacterium]HPN72363.1 CRISPR-associated endonuclease Cas2 [Saprospiraceae bacterium]
MSKKLRINQYRAMWLLVFFDLPVMTKKERKSAGKLRKKLLEDGFTMFQFSVYLRHCSSVENAEVHEKRIKKMIPEAGKVAVLRITDHQFGKMDIFYAEKKIKNPSGVIQLELF